MESRMVKFYSKESNMVAIHAIPGHFATSHSHINYYIDITSLKTRIQEAKEVARVLHQKIGRVSYVDTIVCMDGTEVIGAFLAEEFEKEDMASTNRHETIYVVSPEMNSNNQLLFRDNIKPSIAGKHVILLSASTTTGKTIHRSLEGIRYYGGVIEAVASVFSTANFQDLLQQRRFQAAVKLLEETDLSIEDISLDVGYENQSYFFRQFKKRFGMTPRSYRITHQK